MFSTLSLSLSEFDNSPQQAFTNSKPAKEPVDVCWMWIVQYIKHASFHFTAVNSEKNRTSALCFVFATLKNGMTSYPYLENKI